MAQAIDRGIYVFTTSSRYTIVHRAGIGVFVCACVHGRLRACVCVYVFGGGLSTVGFTSGDNLEKKVAVSRH